MPIPSKNIDETNEEFIERCMSDEFMKEYDDNDQRLAVCYAQLEDDEERQTNFPNKGDDKKISLRNSEEPQFDFDFAKNIKEQTPEIWKAGGNIRGNEAFMLWERARDGQDTEAIREWIKEREAWIKRHFEDGKQFKGDTEPNLSNVGGVVAQIKWGTIGTLGEQGMKDVILELTKKLEGKKEENQVSDKVKKALENKVEKHNEEVKELDLAWNGRTTYAELVKVFERGVGAYNTNPGSVRPNVSSPEQWAMARVNSFLFALKKGRFQGGKHDTDLLPENHPVKKEMEEKKQVFIVMGASCSGKSTYVRNNANSKDLVFDFDNIHQAISNNPSHIHIDNLKRYVFDVRDALYKRLKKDKSTNAWIINSSPYKKVRKQLVEELDARIIYIQRTKEECLRVAEEERPREWKEYIENYFERFEGFENDEEITIVDMKENKEITLSEKRHIQKIEETDESIIIYYGKNVDDVEMIDEQDDEMDEADHYPGHEEEEKSEIRTNPNAEVRTFDVQDLELRMDGDKPTVVGYGAVFNSMSNDLGGFREYISPKAFEGRLEDDVRFLINHDANLILARTTNGTLRLSVDEKGLRYEADMPNTSTARDLMELLKNGTISQSSFAFTVEEDSWEVKDGMNIRTIDKVSQLYDVSSVTYPAYNSASSSVALRSMKEWQEKEEAKKLEESLDAEKLEGIKEEEDLKQRSLAEMRLKILKNKY